MTLSTSKHKAFKEQKFLFLFLLETCYLPKKFDDFVNPANSTSLDFDISKSKTNKNNSVATDLHTVQLSMLINLTP